MAKKHTLETKIKVVSFVLKENHSKKAAAREFNINKSIVRTWIYAYENHGIEGLKIRDNFYSGDFKVNVIKYMLENKLSANMTAAEFNVASSSTICKWKHIYTTQGEDALNKENKEQALSVKNTEMEKPKKIGKEERKQLLAEIKQLKMENDYLKKLNALVQEKEILEKETK